tara:strand:+ start:4688 stop:7567 length:2880 start_codon:yes stop_codon:yes gene_type:complete
MSQRIVKTLLVGLGGTGNLALKYAKKRFFEMYATGSYEDFDLPLVQYLALDTDLSDLKKGVGADEKFCLKPSEWLSLVETNPASVLRGTPFIQKQWFPKITNFQALEDGNGAGQVRSLGRLSLMSNYTKIKNAVEAKVQELNNWEQNQNPDFEAIGNEINVVFCFSVSGGTGSGTFLDVAYLVKSALENSSVDYKSQAYIVLPEIFDKIISNPLGKKRIWSNAYGALRELEFFMNHKYDKDFELLDNNRMTIPVNGQPFSLVHLVSAQNSIGTDYDSISHIMELIGNNIVLKSGKFESKARSGWSQIGSALASFDFLDDAKTQMPRYLGLGYAEIQYNTELIADFVSAKYSAALADLIIDSNNRESEISLEQKVLSWGIKEDEADDVIDQLLPLNSYTPFVLDGDGYDGSNTRSPLESNAVAHLSHQIQELKKKSAANLAAFQGSVLKNITDDFINTEGCILDKGGVNTAIDAIEKLLVEPFIKRYAYQMDDEIENNYAGSGKGLKHSIKTIEKRIQDELKDLSKAQDSNIFVKKGNCMPIIDSLVSSYNKLLEYNLQKIRREDAKQFYAKLDVELEKLKTKLSNFKTKVGVCKNYFHTSSKDSLKLMKQKIKPFVKNLANSDLDRLGLDVSSIQLSLFLSDRNLFSYISTSQDEIKKEIEGYIRESSLLESIQKENLTTFLEKTDKQVVVKHFSELQKMSQPLLQVNKSRFSLDLGDGWIESELWGVGSNATVYDLIKDINAKPDIMETNDHSFLMLSTMNYPAPIFALTNMQRYYDAYYNKRSSVSSDTDKRIREAMDDANFDLIPKDVAQEKTICAWIFGLILHKLTDGEDGIYRKGSGKFFVKTTEADVLDDSWFDLETPWRTTAFEMFRDKDFEGEMLKKVRIHLDSIGGDKVKTLIQEIKDKDLYISRYSNLNRSLSELRQSQDSRDKEVAELLKEEIKFINTLSVESINDYL